MFHNFHLMHLIHVQVKGAQKLMSNEDASFAGIKAHQIYTAFETAA